MSQVLGAVDRWDSANKPEALRAPVKTASVSDARLVFAHDLNLRWFRHWKRMLAPPCVIDKG
eukprot:12903926-Prorocentrum_lima.AAC.1